MPHIVGTQPARPRRVALAAAVAAACLFIGANAAVAIARHDAVTVNALKVVAHVMLLAHLVPRLLAWNVPTSIGRTLLVATLVAWLAFLAVQARSFVG